MDEISLYNVPVKRRGLPKEASRLLRVALDDTLSLALSIHHSSLALGLQCVRPLRPLSKATPPPSTGRMPRKLRGRGALEEVLYAEGRGDRDATQ